ncbi:MAG: radical SAM protein [Candidatus Odinarchaeota archaeon]
MIIKSSYRIKTPIVKKSKLTRDISGKHLSDGWSCNIGIGCTHGCPFCYVPAFLKYEKEKNRLERKFFDNKWGSYLAIPYNLSEAIGDTPWLNWKDQEVLLSSMHDPFLPQLKNHTLRILQSGLEVGVKFCIQTRSVLVQDAFHILSNHSDQIRVQVSVCTLDKAFSRLIEPGVSPPQKRLDVLKMAKECDLKTGLIIAPVFPDVPRRKGHWYNDVRNIIKKAKDIELDYLYAEALHRRGNNIALINKTIGSKLTYEQLESFEPIAKARVISLFQENSIKGIWWDEKRFKAKSRREISKQSRSDTSGNPLVKYF